MDCSLQNITAVSLVTHAQDPAKRAALEKFEQRLVQ